MNAENCQLFSGRVKMASPQPLSNGEGNDLLANVRIFKSEGH